jgi:hypothetical protein
MEPNLAESIYIRSSINFLHFVPIRFQAWPPQTILVSDWLISKKSELNEHSLERTFQGNFLPSFGSFGKAASEEKILSILGRSFIKIAHLVPIR